MNYPTEHISVRYLDGSMGFVWAGDWDSIVSQIGEGKIWIKCSDPFSRRPVLIRASQIASICFWNLEGQERFVRQNVALKDLEREVNPPESPWE